MIWKSFSAPRDFEILLLEAVASWIYFRRFINSFHGVSPYFSSCSSWNNMVTTNVSQDQIINSSLLFIIAANESYSLLLWTGSWFLEFWLFLFYTLLIGEYWINEIGRILFILLWVLLVSQHEFKSRTWLLGHQPKHFLSCASWVWIILPFLYISIVFWQPLVPTPFLSDSSVSDRVKHYFN